MTCDMPTYQGIPDKEQTFSVAFLEDTTLVSMPVASLRLLSEADWLTQLEGLILQWLTFLYLMAWLRLV